VDLRLATAERAPYCGVPHCSADPRGLPDDSAVSDRPCGVRVPVCSIRAYEPADAKALGEAAPESVGEVHQWLPWCHPQHSMAEAEE
jgi:hypothetical protein